MTEENISSIEIRRAGNQEYYYVFRLTNDGIFVSIFFDSISEIKVAIEYSQRISTDDARYLCKTNSEGDDYFVFLTKNNKPIGQSTIFEQTSKMNAGIHYMQKHLQRADVADLTTVLFSYK